MKQALGWFLVLYVLVGTIGLLAWVAVLALLSRRRARRTPFDLNSTPMVARSGTRATPPPDALVRFATLCLAAEKVVRGSLAVADPSSAARRAEVRQLVADMDAELGRGELTGEMETALRRIREVFADDLLRGPRRAAAARN